MLDGDTLVNSAAHFGLGDEMFVYLEPGYSLNDYFAVGLPLEFHAGDMADKDDDAFWVVPTIYIYPHEKVQWWIWGQVVLPAAEGASKGYGIGSEIIVEF